MKQTHHKHGFTLIELLITLAIIGVFCVLLTQIVSLENRIVQDSEAMLCIQNEERYVSEFFFETLYSVESVQVSQEEGILPISAFDFSYLHNQCPILGYRGEKTIRFTQEGTELKICEIYRGRPQIKKTIAYHVIDASCEMIQNKYRPCKPLLHITLLFEAGHTQKEYDLLFALRNVS